MMRYRVLTLSMVIIAATSVGGCASQSQTSAPTPPTYNATPTYRRGLMYPPRAQYEGVQADVLLCFTVDPDGSVENIHVTKTQFWTSTGKAPDGVAKREIKSTAIETVRQWRFKPRRANGKAVKGTACQTVRFRIHR